MTSPAEVAAIAFEATLPADALQGRPFPAGPWPELTPERLAALTQLRGLVDVHDPARLPRPACPVCFGAGWVWVDPDMNARPYDPCRPCLTSGLQLRPAGQ